QPVTEHGPVRTGRRAAACGADHHGGVRADIDGIRVDRVHGDAVDACVGHAARAGTTDVAPGRPTAGRVPDVSDVDAPHDGPGLVGVRRIKRDPSNPGIRVDHVGDVEGGQV